MKFIYKKVLVSVVAMVLIIEILGAVTLSLGPFDVGMHLKMLGSGETVIHFPPLGRVAAATHFPPVDIHFTLSNINVLELTQLLEGNSLTSLSDYFYAEIVNILVKYIIILSASAFVIGMAISSLWRAIEGKTKKFFKKEAFILGSINVLVLFVVMLVSFFSFNPAAFSQENVEYEGVLEAAPWVFDVLGEGTDVIEDIEMQFTDIKEGVSYLQEEIERDRLLDEEDMVTVLHVTDIHNNPVAFNIIDYVKSFYNVDFIIDTGDIVDYGTTWEVDFFTRVDTLDVPYVLIPGNHEAPAAVSYFKEMENVMVIEEGVEEIEGLRVAGIADPASYTTAMEIDDEAEIEKSAQKLQEIVQGDSNIDIIAAHNPDILQGVRNSGNLLLTGHTHVPSVEKEGEYIEINAGTTGASGSRGIQGGQVTFSLVLINFYYSEDEMSYKPFSADLIKVEPFPLNFHVKRYMF